MQTIQLLRKLDSAQWGGTETAMQRLFEGLRSQGVAATVYCPRLKRPAAEANPLTQSGCNVRRFRAFIPILGISSRRRSQLVAVGGNLMSFDLLWQLRREKNAALVHSHALGRIGGIARLAARRLHLPFVLSIHGGVLDLPENLREEFNAPCRNGWEWGKPFGWLLRARRLFHDADALVTCNDTEAALLQKRFPTQRVVVQPHGVPLELYQRNHRAAALEAFPQIRGRRLLLCVGRVDPVKNQLWLVGQAPAIFRRHPQAALVLAGPCTHEAYGELIAKRIEELGLQNRIFLTGALPPNDPRLIGLLQEAAAVVLPSVSETFGLVVLEAWAAGTMVLSSRASGPAALVRNGENGWLFGLDRPEEFHQALERTLLDATLAAQMAARGTRLAGQFSVEASARRLKKLYEVLIEERRCAT